MVIIDSFSILGYGELRSCGLKGLSAGLNVFWGGNEAGKTTCLSFFRDMLFGFPTLRSRYRSYPLGKGVVGRLGLAVQEGKGFVLERSPGPKGGKVRMLSCQGEELSETVLQDLLGGTTREVFQNIFAFSLDELQTFSSLNAEQIKGVIYSAGLGTRLRSVPQAQAVLRQDQEKIFKKRGQVQAINQRLKELVQVEEELTASNVQMERYQELKRQEKAMHNLLKDQQKRLADISTRQFKLQTLFNLWEEWQEFRLLKDKLAGFPVMDYIFPAQARFKYERLNSALEGLSKEEQALLSRRTSLEERQQKIVIPLRLLDEEQSVDGLAAGLDRYIRDWQAKDGLEQELGRLEQTMHLALQELGPLGSLDQLRKLDASLVVREKIKSFKERFLVLDKEQERKNERLQVKIKEIEELTGELDLLEHELARDQSLLQDLDFSVVSRLQEQWGGYVQSCQEIERLKLEIQEAEQRLQIQLQEIDPGWQRQDLERINLLSQELYAQVAELEQEIAGLQAQEGQLTESVGRSREELDLLQDKLDEISVQLAGRDAKDLSSRVRELRAGLDSFIKMQGRRESLDWQHERLAEELNKVRTIVNQFQQKSKRQLIWGAGCAVSGGIICLLAIVFSRPFILPFLILGGGLLAGGLGICWWAKKGGGLDFWVQQETELHARLKDLEQKRIELREQFQELVASLIAGQGASDKLQPGCFDPNGVEEGVGDASVLKGLLETMEEEWAEVRELENNRAELEHRIKRLEIKVEKLLQEAEEASSLLRTREGQVQEIAAQLGVQASIRPGILRLLLERIERARENWQQLQVQERRIVQLEKQGRLFLQDVKAIAGFDPFVLDQDRLLARLAAFFQQAEDLKRLQERCQALQESLQLKKKGLKKKQDDLQTLKAELQHLSTQEQDLARQWQAWLDDYGLSSGKTTEAKEDGLAPDFILEVVQRVERIQELDARLDNCKQSLKEQEVALSVFEHKVSGLASKVGRKIVPAGSVLQGQLLIEEVRTLKSALTEARDSLAVKQSLDLQLAEVNTQLERVSKKRSVLQREFADLLAQVGAHSGEEFLAKERTYLEHKTIQERLGQLEQTLCRGLGETDFKLVEDEYRLWHKDTLHQTLSSLKVQVRTAERELQELLDQQGALKNELKQLADSTQRARLRERQEALRTELISLSRVWAKHALAGYLLQRAKEAFEREQQPQVIVKAGKIFADLTQGRYQALFSPLGSDSIKIRTPGYGFKELDELSRGTAEQLYLALRFAYSRHYARQGRKLPLIMDDILVNFDHQRMTRAGKAVLDMAREQQILFFTCHPHQVEMFLDLDPQVRIYRLDKGQFLPGWSRDHQV